MSIIVGCSSDTEEDLRGEEKINKEAKIFYQNNLKSIIDTKCISCHEYHQIGSSRYDSYEKIKPVIHEILDRIETKSINMMPPADAKQLTMEEKLVFRQFLETLTSIADEDTDNKIQIKWTAYKYPDFDNRVSVSGNFDEISYTFNENYGDVPIDIIKDAEVIIKTETVNVGNNEERSKNIRHFFSFFTPTISGKVKKYNTESAYINFEMNGIEQEVIFAITINDSELLLKGVIPDMSFFNWQNAYDELNKICGEQHQNKLWNDIAIEVVIRLD
ncbi:hypothetical protein ABW636_06380 [Aquimarina sp. 2201CG1-2-11]|uniref:hypothetical protein n=1 Tax=Aquimarina discodermiae TaxID=3231043 RepID=UPI0034637105